MTIDEYAEWTATVAEVSHAPTTERLCYLGLGLAAEAVEVADHIKKLLRDEAAMVDELGDVIYYWALPVRGVGQEAV